MEGSLVFVDGNENLSNKHADLNSFMVVDKEKINLNKKANPTGSFLVRQ